MTIVATPAETLFLAHEAELRRFVSGVVRDPVLADDIMQATFVKAVEIGHTACVDTMKGWLFRVAYHEALAVRRRQRVQDRAHQKQAEMAADASQDPDARLILSETIEGVRHVFGELPVEQQQVVWARIYEEKSFAVIAREFGLPLGTVQTRMRLALVRLRRALTPGD